eukprot:1792061-Alexandrium_andersonii.AAC.1
MSASLVGSEMCIRDRCHGERLHMWRWERLIHSVYGEDWMQGALGKEAWDCLLYTSDAADDM